MEIKKIGTFSEEELEKLKTAGTILGATAKSLEAKEIDSLDETALKLVAALKNVLERL